MSQVLTSAEELAKLAREKAKLDVQVEAINDRIDSALAPCVAAWKDVEPPPCGHTGGWGYDSIDEDGEYVVLRHDCFYAHQYDRHNEYTTRVSLHDLLLTTHVPSEVTE
jgi:hypothetical protein